MRSDAVANDPQPAVVSSDHEGPVIALSSNCTVKDAVTLKQTLCALADHATDVALDAREVERVDTATLQLLYAFIRDRAARQLGVIWLGVSMSLRDAANMLGLKTFLALPEQPAIGNGAAK